MPTYMAKNDPAIRKWVLIDLKDKTLGRVATEIANILRGKHRPTFTPHVDAGDFVVAINASGIKLTGKKLEDKKYYWHSRYMGGLKKMSAGELLQKKPEELIFTAVKGMLPQNDLSRKLITKLKVYAGAEHPHKAQIGGKL